MGLIEIRRLKRRVIFLGVTRFHQMIADEIKNRSSSSNSSNLSGSFILFRQTSNPYVYNEVDSRSFNSGKKIVDEDGISYIIKKVKLKVN